MNRKRDPFMPPKGARPADLQKWVNDSFSRPHWSGFPLFILMFFIFVSFIVSPYFVKNGTIDLGDDGVVGGEEHEETIQGIEDPFARFVYSFGERFCHQKESRSWNLNGNQMPVCTRDVGLFFGLVLGCMLGASYGKSFHIIAVLLLITPMVIDGGLQALTGYESFNLLRLITGILGGIGIGGFINGSIVYVVKAALVKRVKKG
jgi:uncharacterized membrane protein